MAPKYGYRATHSSKVYRTSKKDASPAIQKAVRKEILKKADVKELTSSGTINPTTTGSVVCINQIAEGDDYNQRNGRRIQTQGIDVMYTYLSNSANASGGGQVALVYDAQPNGATAAITDIYNIVVNAGLAFRNTVTYADRFKIFWMDLLPQSTGSDATNGYLHHIRHYVNSKKIGSCADVRYGLTTAATPNTGAWYLVAGDSLNTTTNASMRYVVKYAYTDI